MYKKKAARIVKEVMSVNSNCRDDLLIEVAIQLRMRAQGRTATLFKHMAHALRYTNCDGKTDES